MIGFRRLSSMQKLVLGVFFVLLAAAGGAFFLFKKAEPQAVACTMEAKLCSDGSYVGRVGPKCEFALCPGESEPSTTKIPNTAPPPATDGPAVVRTWVGHKASGGGVSITPLEVVEDSRCPTGVYCIQAGTVRIKAVIESGLGKSTMTFTLGTPVTTEAETIVLSDVQPFKTQSHTIAQNEYKISFTVEKKK